MKVTRYVDQETLEVIQAQKTWERFCNVESRSHGSMDIPITIIIPDEPKHFEIWVRPDSECECLPRPCSAAQEHNCTKYTGQLEAVTE